MDNEEFASRFKEIKGIIEKRVRLSVPNDGGTIQDITAAAIADYLSYVTKKTKNSQKHEKGIKHKRILAEDAALISTITARRIADYYRESSQRKFFIALDQRLAESIESASPSQDNVYHKNMLLLDTLREISLLPEKQQKLLLRNADSGVSSEKLTSSERQALHRARNRLREKMESRYGITLKELLKNN